jgi:hypothetical protein
MRASSVLPQEGLRRHLGATPISRGFNAAQGVRLLTLAELVALQHITEWAARGAAHENRSALAAELMADAQWLNRQIGIRAARMQAIPEGRTRA